MTDNVYSQLVGEGTTGNFVIQSQGGSEGFSRVSQFWMPNCKTFEQTIEELEEERKNRRDTVSQWKNWEFTAVGRKLQLKNMDGETFNPTEFALMQALKFCSVSQTHIKQTLDPEFEADNADMDQLVDLLNYRKQRHDQNTKNEERNLIFRTYSDNTLRAVLTTQYAPIDNIWFLSVLKDLIPGGMISHSRGSADSLYFNVLLPDNVREEKESNYGGMFSCKNSEIGELALDTCPSLFSSICRNGNIWDRKDGVRYRQVHKGKIVLADLAMEIGENLDKQIKIIPEIMEKFLALRQYEFKKDVRITNMMAQLAKDGNMTKEQSSEMITQWVEKEKNNRTAFGLISAITRMSQKFDAATCNKFDIFGGSLIGANWDNIVTKSKLLTDDEVKKILHLSA